MKSLYLAQAFVPSDIAARWNEGRGFADSYAWHQRAWEAFPGVPDAARDFLTRLDDCPGGFRLLLLSARPPTRPAWCPEPGWQAKAISAAFLGHQSYHFSVVANPSRKVRSNAQGVLLKHSRRLAILHRDDREVDGKPQAGLISWLVRQGGLHGFRMVHPEQTLTIPQARQYFLKKSQLGLHLGT